MRYQYIYTFLWLTLAVFLPANHVKGQENTNYVLTETVTSEKLSSIETYQFFDGLGREMLRATNGISNNGDFSYSLKELQGEKFVIKNWLPVVDNPTIANIGINDIISMSSNQYSSDAAYENSEYDALGRLRKRYNAGSAWKTTPATVSYVTNTIDEPIKRYTISSSTPMGLSENGYYDVGTLYGIRHTDEDGFIATTYNDVYGKKILERRGLNNDTYYVYDDFDRLRYVLMPEYQHNADLDKYTFQYSYDMAGNITMKKFPGCAPVEYLYDDYDRCISIQDGELREKGLYRFILYDCFGRLVIQGLSQKKPQYVDKSVVAYSCGSIGFEGTGYSTKDGYSLDLSVVAVEVANYYDDYSFLNGTTKEVFHDINQIDLSYAKGMLAGSVVLASNGEKIACVNRYDIRGNLIMSQRKSLSGNIEKTENEYSYTNKLAYSKVTIYGAKGDTIVCYTNNSYNSPNDYLTDVTYQVMVGSLSTDACKISYTYDQLGRIESVNRPLKNGTGDILYEYDIHGWLTNITSDSFCEQLHYNDGTGTLLFNGNISSLTWKNNASSGNKGYRFTYDDLIRLSSSEYGENDFTNSIGNYNESVDYDSNGNITTLVRNGMMQEGGYGAIDNLSMTYDGNQLSTVEEKASPILYANSLDVKNGSADIQYNSNGSIIVDGTRGITNIIYDNHNNPVRIQFENGNVTKYIYSATGEKLRTIHYTAAENVHISIGCDYDEIEDEYLSVDTTDYLLGGNVIFTNAKLSKILFAGGYVNANYVKVPQTVRPRRTPGMTDEEYRAKLEQWIKQQQTKKLVLSYRFYNKDHLGNIREVIDEDGKVCQTNDYYPYGTPFSSPSSTINATYQPFKYNGKEFDMMHALNTYDYGARQYYPLLPMWDRIDPLAERYYNVSPYAYCVNNPVRWVDKFGLEPGDFFKTKNEAAIDFGFFYNPGSIKQNIEFASFIMYDPSKRRYYYPKAISGKKDAVKGAILTKKSHKKVAMIHTHGAYDKAMFKDGVDWNDEFSGMEDTPNDNMTHIPQNGYDDISSANERNMDSYVVTPNGNLKKYNSQTGRIEIVSRDMPSDKAAGKRRVNNNNVDEGFNIMQFLKNIMSYFK